MKKLPVITLAALAVTACSVARGQSDQIYPLRGAPTRGTITKMTPAEVTLDAGVGPRNFPVNQIQKIGYAEDPAELRTARDRVLAGQFEDALVQLNKLSPASLTRDVVRQDLDYYKAYCSAKLALTGGGDKTAAASAMIQFITSNGGSYHYFEACEVVGDLAFALGRHDYAADYYRKLDAAPWPDYKMRSNVLEARALRAGGQFDDALQKYESVIAASVDTPEANRQKQLAAVGKAVCLAETGKPEEGKTLLETLIKNNDPQDGQLFGRAYNALGQCHLKMNQPKDALLAFLHTDILFYSEPETHAEALYHLARLWGQVNQSDRSVRARSLLKERYAGTQWASKS